MESQEHVIHNSRRSAGGSLWSGFKQMFNNKNAPEYPPRGQHPQPPQRPSKRLEHSSFSYSCLGNSNSRRSEDDMYGGSSPAQSSLSRNISYSHESVFQMDPPNNTSEVRMIVMILVLTLIISASGQDLSQAAQHHLYCGTSH